MKKKILYVITNVSMPNLVKVGVADDLDKRLKDLNTTPIPTRFQIYESFDKIKNPEILEQEILRVFATKRINKKREFMEEHPERICDFIKVNKDIDKEKNTEGLFAKIGIEEGKVLNFYDGEKKYTDIRATVSSGKNVIFEGRKHSLSSSALLVLNREFGKTWKAAQGTVYWIYQGKTIAELKDEKSV